MKDALILLLVIAVFFVAMYAYSYSTEYIEKRKQKKLEKLQMLKELQLNEQLESKRKIITEKYDKIQQRSEEIKAEFERLSNFRQNVFQKYGTKKDSNNVNIA